MKKLILNNSLRKEMSDKGKKLVDGNGKSRTVDFMFHRWIGYKNELAGVIPLKKLK